MTTRILITNFILPAVIIVAVSLYLTFRNTDRLLYELPQLEKYSISQVSMIKITKGDNELVVTRKDDGWVLGSNEYPAALAQVDAMLNTLVNINITDLVSETSTYSRFELDPESVLRVITYKDGSVIQSIDIGKEARTYQHTYVRLENDSNVYQAEGNLGNTFPVTAEALRDKIVLVFDPALVSQINVRTLTEELILKKRPSLEEGAAASWSTSKGLDRDSTAVEEALQQLSDLSTFRFADEEASLENTILGLDFISEDGKKQSLRIFEKEGNSYPGQSSDSSYPFLLFVWMVNGFLDAFTVTGAPSED